MRKKMRKEKRQLMSLDYSFISILTGSDLSTRRLPLMIAKSIKEGPVVWITACIHGDELGGVAVIQEVFKRLKRFPLLNGSIYAFPIMNPSGFETASRNITQSKEDLNRSFTGNENGSLAERIAYKIFTTIKETKPSLVLDLHNDWRKSIPYTLIDSATGLNKEIYEKTKEYGKKIGFPLILDTEMIEHTLTYSLLKKGIPSLTIELGESYVVNERDVENGVKAVWNALAHLKMVEQIPEPISIIFPDIIKNNLLKYYYKPVSSTSGIIRFLIKPGQIVKKDQPIAKIYNAFGKMLETLDAKKDGIVLGYSDSSASFPGAPVMAFGVF